MKSVYYYITLILLAFVISCPNLAEAESIQYKGITLPITSIEELGGDVVKIELFNETRVLNQQNVGSYILMQYAKERSRVAQLSKIELKEAVFANLDDINFFRTLFTIIEKGDAGFAKEIVIKLSKTEGAATLVTEVASSAIGFINEDQAALFLVAAGLHDPNFIGARMRPEELLFRESLPAAVDSFLSDAAFEFNLARLYKIIELGGRLNLPHTNSLIELRETMQRVEEAIKNDDVKLVYDLVDRRRSAHLYSSVYQPILHQAVTTAAEKRSSSKPVEGLQLIASIDFTKRTPRIHKIVQDALNSLSSAEGIVHDIRLDLMLRSFAVKDPVIGDIYLARLDALFIKELDESNPNLPEAIAHSLQRIISIRQDPHPKNDNLRLLAAAALTKRGYRSQAVVLLLEREAKLTIPERCKLLISGYYAPRWMLGLVLLIISALSFLIFRRTFPSKQSDTNTYTRSREATPDPVSGDGFKNRKVSQLPPDFDVQEYQNYLNVFGLSFECEEKEIKKAYREAVKEHHPDMQKDTMANERFIELTQAYERLLELTIKRRARF